MPILDSVLPKDLNPYLKHAINGVVIFHLLVFVLLVFLICRSFLKSPQDTYKD